MYYIACIIYYSEMNYDVSPNNKFTSATSVQTYTYFASRAAYTCRRVFSSNVLRLGRERERKKC